MQTSSIVTDLLKVRMVKVILIALHVAFIIIVPCFFILLIQPDLFLKIDILKLLIACSGFGLILDATAIFACLICFAVIHRTESLEQIFIQSLVFGLGCLIISNLSSVVEILGKGYQNSIFWYVNLALKNLLWALGCYLLGYSLRSIFSKKKTEASVSEAS